MSSTAAAPARHPRLRRIILTGTLLIAATATVVVFGQTGVIAPAIAASVHEDVTAQPPASDRQLLAESAPIRAIVRQQQEEQAAKAAAAAAAAEAARVAAAEAHTVNVWTAGWRAQINGCQGGVDITAHYGTPTVAQHWGCGGSSFPTAAGAIVHFAGPDAGSYRVIGVVAVLNAYTVKTDQLPRGYDMLFQTCCNDDSHTTEFVALQKVG